MHLFKTGTTLAIVGAFTLVQMPAPAEAGSRGLGQGLGIAAGVIAGGLILKELSKQAPPSARAATRAPRQERTEPRSVTTAVPDEDDPAVKERIAVQKALAARGFDVGNPDGKFGQKTRKAISEFQESRGEDATGELTDRQRTALLQQGNGGTDQQIGSGQGGEPTPGGTSGSSADASRVPVPSDQGGITNEVKAASAKLEEVLGIATTAKGGRLQRAAVKPDGSIELTLAALGSDGAVSKVAEQPPVVASGPPANLALATEPAGDRTKVTLSFIDPSTRTLQTVTSRSFESADDAKMWMKGLQSGLAEVDAAIARVKTAGTAPADPGRGTRTGAVSRGDAAQ